jgi:hypothetical protein
MTFEMVLEDPALEVHKANIRIVDWSLLGALALTLAAFALRAYDLPAQALWSDEIFVYRFTSLPLAQMWPALAQSEPHPPLYYTLIHLWRLVAGASEICLRYPSLFFGMLCVPGGYVLGRRLYGPSAGLVAALILLPRGTDVYHAGSRHGAGGLRLVASNPWRPAALVGDLFSSGADWAGSSLLLGSRHRRGESGGAGDSIIIQA